jgi:hypothetical protein
LAGRQQADPVGLMVMAAAANAAAQQQQSLVLRGV